MITNPQNDLPLSIIAATSITEKRQTVLSRESISNTVISTKIFIHTHRDVDMYIYHLYHCNNRIIGVFSSARKIISKMLPVIKSTHTRERERRSNVFSEKCGSFFIIVSFDKTEDKDSLFVQLKTKDCISRK